MNTPISTSQVSEENAKILSLSSVVPQNFDRWMRSAIGRFRVPLSTSSLYLFTAVVTALDSSATSLTCVFPVSSMSRSGWPLARFKTSSLRRRILPISTMMSLPNTTSWIIHTRIKHGWSKIRCHLICMLRGSGGTDCPNDGTGCHAPIHLD